MNKKLLSLVLISGLIVSGVFASGAQESGDSAGKKVAGFVWYNYADTFITSARTVVANEAVNGPVALLSTDSQNDIAMQANNINALFAKKVDYICINNISPNDSASMIQKAKDQNIPILFVNCTSPTEEELASYDKVYHISSAAEQSGWIQGDAVSEYWKAHSDADRNGNGKLDYIMLVGMQGNYDSQMRTDKSIERVVDNGIEVNCLQEMLCDWQRGKAMNQVASVLAANGNDIDAIFANNDDMALGAIEALKASGYLGDGPYIPVVGVDATKVGVQAIEEGTLLATSLNNPVTLGKTIYKVLTLLDEGQPITDETVGATMTGKHIWLDYVAITKDNIEDAAY
ncbi:MAG: galactose ABC transporter substrate-binding protein [Spirochaetales bacterium]|nr:galactose ABC transporter substrate-binding protein [Spirochaetales bacterium]